MKEKLQQLRFLFVPYLLIAICVPAITVLVMWSMEANLGYLTIGPFATGIILPAVLSGLAIFFFLRNRLHSFKLDNSAVDGPGLVQGLSLLCITFSSWAAQDYFYARYYSLVHVRTVEDINLSKPTRYYKIDELSVNKENALTNSSTNTIGKYGRRLELHAYFVCPAFANDKDSIFWYGVTFRDEIQTERIDPTVPARFKGFLENAKLQFLNYQFPKAEYYENIANGRERDGYLGAISKRFDVENNKLIILKPVTAPFEERGKRFFSIFFITFGFSSILVFVVAIRAKLDKAKWTRYKNGPIGKDDWLYQAISFVVPQKPHIETSILIDAILIISCVAFTVNEVYVNTIFMASILEIFFLQLLHLNPFHIIINIVSLACCGSLLEPVIRKLWLIILFFVLNIAAMATSLIFLPEVYIIGASGAVMGYFGMVTSLLIRRKIQLGERVWYYLLLFVLLASLNMVLGFTLSETNNIMNGAGLVLGTLIGVFLPVRAKEEQSRL